MRPKITITTRSISEKTGYEGWSETLTYYPPLICWPWYYYEIANHYFWKLMRRLGSLFVR